MMVETQKQTAEMTKQGIEMTKQQVNEPFKGSK